MRGVDIELQTRKLEVDQNIPLRHYFRSANNVLRQAEVYRREGNNVELFVLLLRFASLIMETIPEHREYRSGAYKLERDEFMKKLPKALDEVEILKPLVKKLHVANSRQMAFASGAEEGAWPAYEFDGSADYLFDSSNVAGGSGGKGNGSLDLLTGQMDLLTGQMDLLTGPTPRRQVATKPQYASLSGSLSIPQAKQETVSRHSFLGQIAPQQRSKSVQPWVPYPTNLIDSTPIVLSNLDKSPQNSELIAWEEPKVGSPNGRAAAVDVAPEVKLIRQPSPPPIEAPVQTIPRPDDVADPRPGPPVILEDKQVASKGPQPIHISVKMMEGFMNIVKPNTQKNLETCGVLAGILKQGKFYITALLLPKQTSTSDSCQTTNEEEIFEAIDKRGLFQLGWIHTHPSQSCFMSSIDLHTHYSYQIMSQESVAIVMAPSDRSRKYGIFRLSDPGGVKVIQNCHERGFHPHAAPPDGGPIYEHSSHAFLNPGINFEFIDLR